MDSSARKWRIRLLTACDRLDWTVVFSARSKRWRVFRVRPGFFRKEFFTWIAAAISRGLRSSDDQTHGGDGAGGDRSGLAIHIYATRYMRMRAGTIASFRILTFHVFHADLVLAANYVLLFVGWEGVGLASYLLIGFYFLKKSASDAGKKAFIVNRIGDFGFHARDVLAGSRRLAR